MQITEKGVTKKTSLTFIKGFSSYVSAGFPSPADDHLDAPLDLNSYLITHPSATFYCRVSGNSMTDLGIFDRDILIVDRALTPEQDNVVIAAINGELTCKILDIKNNRLMPANCHYSPIDIPESSSMLIEGVVIHSIRDHKKSCLR